MDVKLFGYDFRGHIMAVLTTRVQRFFHLFFLSTTSEKSFIPYKTAEQALTVHQFGQKSYPAGEYLHSKRLWMFEKVSAALKTTPTTIPQTPHISKNLQTKKKNRRISLLEKMRAADES